MLIMSSKLKIIILKLIPRNSEIVEILLYESIAGFEVYKKSKGYSTASMIV